MAPFWRQHGPMLAQKNRLGASWAVWEASWAVLEASWRVFKNALEKATKKEVKKRRLEAV